MRDDHRPIHKVPLHDKVGVWCAVSKTRITQPTFFYNKFRKTHWTNSWTIFENSSNHRRNMYFSSKMLQLHIQPRMQWLSKITLFCEQCLKLSDSLNKLLEVIHFLFLEMFSFLRTKLSSFMASIHQVCKYVTIICGEVWKTVCL